MHMLNFPKVVQSGISCEHIGLETLVYDNRSHKAFCLNQVAALVWKLADGTRSLRQIAAQATLALSLPITEDAVVLALEQFEADGLLQNANGLLQNAAGLSTAPLDPSRRDALRKVGFGAAMLVPVIAAVMAPRAAQAYSGCVDCSAGSTTAHAMAKKNQQQAGVTPAPAPAATPAPAEEKPDPDEPHQEYLPQ